MGLAYLPPLDQFVWYLYSNIPFPLDPMGDTKNNRFLFDLVLVSTGIFGILDSLGGALGFLLILDVNFSTRTSRFLLNPLRSFGRSTTLRFFRSEDHVFWKMTAGGLTNLVWSQATLVSDRELKCFNTYFALELHWRCRNRTWNVHFPCNEFKLFQSPLNAGVGISWTGSLAWRDSFCRVAVSRYQICFGFKVHLRHTLWSHICFSTSFTGPCTSWKVNEHWIFNQARSPGTDKGPLLTPPLHCTFAQVISSTSCWLRMKEWFFNGPNIWTKQIFFANHFLLQKTVYIVLVHAKRFSEYVVISGFHDMANETKIDDHFVKNPAWNL